MFFLYTSFHAVYAYISHAQDVFKYSVTALIVPQ